MRYRSLLTTLLVTCASVALASPAEVTTTSTTLARQTRAPEPTTFIKNLESDTSPLRPRNDDYAPSIPPVSIPPVSIPPVSLNLPSQCTPTIPPGKDGYRPPGTCGAMWNYFPSFAAAVVFSILFGILLVAHLGQALHHQTGYGWVIVMASLWEAGSYITRAAGSKDQSSSSLATVSQILVLLSPLWVNAFAYMVFARVVNFYSPTRKVWVLSPSILTVVFVTLDFVSFIIQLIGGGMAGPGADAATAKKGINIYMGGIGMQEGFIVIFVGLIIKFHLDQIQAERRSKVAADKRTWRPLTYTLYVCLLFITIRIIFRLIEFSGGMGTDNPLPNTEGYFYGLDGVPMWIALGVWNIYHPGRFMQGPDAVMPPSWLSRKLCCCCHRGRKDNLGPHQRLDDPPSYDGFRETANTAYQPTQPADESYHGYGYNGGHDHNGYQGHPMETTEHWSNARR